MRANRKWTSEEIEYLSENYGSTTMETLVKVLERTPSAIKNKVARLNLGRWYSNAYDVNLNEFAIAMNVTHQTLTRWSKLYDFPISRKRFQKTYFHFVVLEDFWKWAEKHKNIVQWNKLEKHLLGAEPEWVDEMRTSKFRSTDLSTKKKKWSKDEIEKLRWMLNQYKFTYPEICQELGRSHGAVKRKIHDLGIKQRPVYLPNTKKYSTEEVNEILRLYEKGYSFKQISTKLGRSEAGVRGKIERMGYTFTNKLMKASEEDDKKSR
ncbi:helix-turn-helix domain-containing protein [Enterococcus faecalis]|uniref:helix-turn-helix domain-containing protein n=1 Tax=Enterococcus faecalis TaxID=1351 RepID=UPI002091C422|nr:helix-turn-helix domain-containing protein [Enterococcus faecalis]MCO5525151.1 helix-turn-helix domain-containing protein [Enterococcus faecalis]